VSLACLIAAPPFLLFAIWLSSFHVILFL